MILTQKKIIDIWKTKGWHKTEDYHSFLKKNISWDTLDVLDPDKVSPKAFWKASDKWFFYDTIQNLKNCENSNLDIETLNEETHKIALYSGMLGQMEWLIYNCKRKFNEVNIGEIGCGYGSFYQNFVQGRTDITSYRPFDIVKRFDGVIEPEAKDGTFTSKQVDFYKGKINLFYSCNVFQHLSEKKITKYFKQMYDILPTGGHAVVAYVKTDKEGSFSYHYGQKVNLLMPQEYFDIIKNIGFKIENTTIQNILNNKTFNLIVTCISKYS